jgi:hypothetical protein
MRGMERVIFWREARRANFAEGGCMHAKPVTVCAWAALATLAWISSVAAHDLSADECREGADFIEHAAMSRDYGLSREDFLRRLEEDIQAIQAFPPALRWFVQDAADEELLVAAAQRVFDVPRTPEDHRSEFVEACAARVTAGLGGNAPNQKRSDPAIADPPR